ncbi:ParA family protein [Nisaea acidiphila]|uniref:ParA family protein n=1 Tax=Nisaea acidiphila TaxID=1862145 RepID=A0A9J7AVX7_9PROT|nr:ParA family partition ATPase [Nisaea acidiphila]UUX49581.1 ParA family protein [Nisaea acidiphila]
MTGTIITIAQQKGGAGKTTLAAQLAVALAHSGKSVAAIDIDPQISLATWFGMRNSLNGAIGYKGKGALEIVQITGWRAASEIEKQAKLHDVVIVDSPPHAETEAKIAIRNAHLVLIPVQPSPMDVWATKPTLEIAAAEKTPVLLVLNRVPPRAKLTERMSAALKELKVPLAKATIGNRVALASSMADGLGVVEAAKRSVAAQEIAALAKAALKAAG